LAETLVQRGMVFSHEGVRDWAVKLAPVLADDLRRRGQGTVTIITPGRVTTDGHGSCPRAIRSAFGRRVLHRTRANKTNGLEQVHGGVKGRPGLRELHLRRAIATPARR